VLCLPGTERPWLKRLDHLICEVGDIDEALALFVDLGFPVAWPVGRFWPQGRTAGVALGGINLEFLQLDDGAPEVARIRTLVFEPFDLRAAATRLADLGLDVRIAEKWESDAQLLQLRGFQGEDLKTPQLLCTNAYLTGEIPVDFFLCDYAPKLRSILSPSNFPHVPPIARVVLGVPDLASAWAILSQLYGLPVAHGGVEIGLREKPCEFPEVVEIVSDRGPIDLKGWAARFTLV